jgi:mucin-2
MRRTILTLIASAIALGTSVSAASATLLPTQPSHLTGTLTTVGGFSFTVQTPGRAVGVISALTVAANRLADEDLPYVWGGGHAEAGIASIGERGPGFNGKRRGYDCSGSVAAVLAGGGLWPTGGAVPNDAGVIGYLLSKHLIASGAGTGAQQITLYDDPGVHIFMNIDGRFFGTSDGGPGGDAKGGPGWLEVGTDVTSGRFKRYHFLPGALGGMTTAGYTVGFEMGAGLGLMDYPTGTKVNVTYKTTASGMLVAEAITLVGEVDATATVTAIGTNGASSLTLKTASGRTLTFNLSSSVQLMSELQDNQLLVGDTVAIGYLGSPSTTLTLISLEITATPPVLTTTTTTPTTTGTTTGTTTTGTTTTGTTTTSPVQTVTAPPAQTSGGSAPGDW